MAPRATASGTISFGLVSIPVKLFTATSSQKVRFNMLEAETGARVKQQYVSTVSGEVVDRGDMVKGYEFSRGQFVTLTEADIKAIESDRTGAIEIVEFVPENTVDLVQIEKSYYLGPDKGGDKAYQLLGHAMRNKGKIGVGRWQARGKEQLVLVRPYRDGLILHQLFYATEVRAFDDVDRGATIEFRDVELELAHMLIDQLSTDSFDASKYADTYTDRVRGLVEQKVAGQDIQVAPEQPKAQIIDLFEALKLSLQDDAAPAEDQGDDDAQTQAEAKPAKKTKTKRKSRAKKSDDDDAPAKPLKKARPRKTKAKKTQAG